MSLTFNRAIRHPTVFRRLTSMSVEEFCILADKLCEEWKRRERGRLESMRNDRKHKIGQGRPYAGSFETMLLLTIMYLRTSTGGAILAWLFGIDEVTMRTWRKRILPLLTDRFIPKSPVMGNRKRINDLDEFLEAYPEVRELIGDGSEFKIQRPKRRQGKNYTGKSKRHVKKSVLGVNEKDGLILGRTKIRPGSVHDKRVPRRRSPEKTTGAAHGHQKTYGQRMDRRRPEEGLDREQTGQARPSAHEKGQAQQQGSFQHQDQG